jgi:uncharacterized protein YbjT (DUF2867 family)
MRVLVTGVSGRIGSAIVPALIAVGRQIADLHQGIGQLAGKEIPNAR